MPVLLPRDESGYALPYLVIIIIIIFGSLCVVILGYAIHRTYGLKEDPNEFKHITEAQATYMAEVRIRNMESLASEGRRSQWGRSGKAPTVEYREG
jgi:hypothetical protein